MVVKIGLSLCCVGVASKLIIRTGVADEGCQMRWYERVIKGFSRSPFIAEVSRSHSYSAI